MTLNCFRTGIDEYCPRTIPSSVSQLWAIFTDIRAVTVILLKEN